MSTVLNDTHLKNMQDVDWLLNRIYADGKNYTRFEEIFISEEYRKAGKVPDAVYFLNTEDSQLKCLDFLKSEGLTEIKNNKYCLTFKGILWVFGNTFESEYRKSIEHDTLLKAVQQTTIQRNQWSLILSIIAIVISIIAIWIKAK
ncbi:MAG: hypothetical protein ABJC12_09760 [Saprospiraceae bacterium]